MMKVRIDLSAMYAMIAMTALYAVEVLAAPNLFGNSGSGGATLNSVAQSAVGIAESGKLVILSLAQLVGLAITFIGGYKLYKHNQQGQEQQGHLKWGIAGIAVGPGLYFLPSLLGLAGRTWLPVP